MPTSASATTPPTQSQRGAAAPTPTATAKPSRPSRGAVPTRDHPRSLRLGCPIRLIHPRSYRARTTYVYTTQLIEDAVEEGRLVQEFDQYLLPPALYTRFLQERAPAPPQQQNEEEEEGEGEGEHAANGGAAVIPAPFGEFFDFRPGGGLRLAGGWRCGARRVG
jgi:hypothetical protein